MRTPEGRQIRDAFIRETPTETPTFARGRITARMTAETQQALQLAADLSGSTINQFIVQAALAAAEDVFARDAALRSILETAKASERLVAVLDAVAKPVSGLG